ncbi:hypothetical protein BFU36_06680 [Sulfolobus sp. A20]|uniref:ParA family protein n=1 Tax=Sulfolobaceae TaxID=118883 RepID=UPI000845CBB1|nr:MULTISPECIES: AAA family ATPase [unclassified Sulfolobus]TRM75273.1 ParA family protein [Sulfolobus sp. E5]TRM77105.1 ParA family protein [Sulfolobus sp. A20-N-F8]TRM78910.1 ParA family protein [Sulfolobus sp. B5]TRM80775.1 ParA family protein [Sulfolobus sp. D5]TRM86739.1 ParA family protein [Sulfolobus sp. E3]TRM86918.1 ParA family protein [Sulfolobus sp. C3]TRM99075.1 ParA family protein [Sulfolobus sp. E1]
MRIAIYILSLKGGIGKTSLAIKMAHSLGRKNRVLLIDNDGMSNLSLRLGYHIESLVDGRYPLDSLVKIRRNTFLLRLRRNPFTQLNDINREKILKDLIGRKYWKYIIVDNWTGITEKDRIIRNIYENVDVNVGLFLTDQLSLDKTLEYLNNWSQLNAKYALLINNDIDSNYQKDIYLKS